MKGSFHTQGFLHTLPLRQVRCSCSSVYLRKSSLYAFYLEFSSDLIRISQFLMLSQKEKDFSGPNRPIILRNLWFFLIAIVITLNNQWNHNVVEDSYFWKKQNTRWCRDNAISKKNRILVTKVRRSISDRRTFARVFCCWADIEMRLSSN